MVHKKLGGASLALAAAIALSGCVSIGSKPPQQLLTLDAAHKVPTGAQSNAGGGRSLIIVDPEAARVIDTVRVPVQVTRTRLQPSQKLCVSGVMKPSRPPVSLIET